MAKQANHKKFKDNSKRGRSKTPAQMGKPGNARAAQEDESDNSDNAWLAREIPDPPIAWIIDSEASRHMNPKGSIFTSKRNIQTFVTVVNGERLRARGVGNVTVNIDGQIIKVTNFLHLPELDGNLLLISALNRNGLSVHFSIEAIPQLPAGCRKTKLITFIHPRRNYSVQMLELQIQIQIFHTR